MNIWSEIAFVAAYGTAGFNLENIFRVFERPRTESPDLRFCVESNCLKKSASQLLLFINRCHVCCSQQKTSDYSVKNR